MSRKPIIMIVDNDPVDDVRMALAKEHHERTSEFGRLCNAGHVKVVNDDDPVNIRCRIEDEYFAEERTRFPSTTLMARMQLAIAAGRSCRNDKQEIDSYDANDLMAYGVAQRKYMTRHQLTDSYGGQTMDMMWVEEAVGQGYANVAKQTRALGGDLLDDLTATVKPLKGVRP